MTFLEWLLIQIKDHTSELLPLLKQLGEMKNEMDQRKREIARI